MLSATQRLDKTTERLQTGKKLLAETEVRLINIYNVAQEYLHAAVSVSDDMYQISNENFI